MRVIYIIWLRQIKRFIRSYSRMVASLAQPLLFLIALGYGFGSIYEQAGQGSYIQFLAPGIIAMTVIFTATFNGASLVFDKQFGFIKETLVAPVSRVSIMLGRALGGATVACFQGIVVFFLAMLFGFMPVDWSIAPLAIVFIFLLALLYSSLGTLIGTFLKDMEGFQLIVNFLIMPSFFLSSAMFSVKNFPPAIEWVARINPLTYGIDGMRGAFSTVVEFSYVFDILYLVAFVVILTFLGAWFFRKMQV